MINLKSRIDKLEKWLLPISIIGMLLYIPQYLYYANCGKKVLNQYGEYVIRSGPCIYQYFPPGSNEENVLGYVFLLTFIIQLTILVVVITLVKRIKSPLQILSCLFYLLATCYILFRVGKAMILAQALGGL